MIRITLTSVAMAGLLGAAAYSQTTPAAEPATPPAMSAPAEGVAAEGMPESGWTAVDLAAVSTDQLVGADLVNYENETVATIDDVLIANDTVEGVVVTFGGVLGFGAEKVLLEPTEIEVMRDANDTLMVRTSLTPEAIESRPAYEDS